MSHDSVSTITDKKEEGRREEGGGRREIAIHRNIWPAVRELAPDLLLLTQGTLSSKSSREDFQSSTGCDEFYYKKKLKKT